MTFDLAFTPENLTLTLRPEKAGLLANLLRRKSARDLGNLPPGDTSLLFAIADLRAEAEERPGELEIGADRIRMSHRLAAALDGNAADALGLPPLVDLTLKTDAEGLIGSPGFRLRCEWTRNGIRQFPQRVGSMLKTSDGLRRLPLWIMEAVEVAENFQPGTDDAVHWGALARFRQALDPGVRVTEASRSARVSMTDFLSGLQVRVANGFSISPNEAMDDFDLVPFDARRLESLSGEEGIVEANSELSGDDLRAFQGRVRERGALHAYRLAPGNFLVIDRAARPALEVMAEMQRAPVKERAGFILNPRPRITDAVESWLKRTGQLEGLTPDAEEQVVEASAGPVFIETRQFSERVTGIKVFAKLLDLIEASGTTWLPETFARELAKRLSDMSPPELKKLRNELEAAIENGPPSIDLDGLALPARLEAVEAIDAHIERTDAKARADPSAEEKLSGPVVLETIVNFDELRWEAKLGRRTVTVPVEIPSIVRTPLMQHQLESFHWQIDAWKAGLPGILNADEQGLGKNIQTIAFLTWLKAHTARPEASKRGPVLIVAPTSLLQNWEQEVSRHTAEPGLGHLIRLYGSAIAGRKLPGKGGRDIETGDSKLDLGFLHEAIEEGRAHRFWLLTTYTTLSNYQHSLARIPFSAAVFDEIQALKNPDSLRAHAARSVNSDFRIGLTGTPIENSAVDLWAIMDQLAPGSLDSLKSYRQRYALPDEANMSDLHTRVFKPTDKRPPLALRRLKDAVVRDLPEKIRLLHPRAMPRGQAAAYENARLKLAQGGLGASLKMLHHIRTVSVHPALGGEDTDANFIAASARVDAAFAVLRSIAARRERALVFIEHRQMQYRFIELARAEFGLERIDLINGETPIAKRQAIVNRFQGLEQGGSGFDLLVLGPKAAGTGLTLTAATYVIHLSRWWNPAVEEQCNDRVHRIGQTRPVSVHVPMAVHPGYREHSFDCLLHSLMQRKRKLATSALWPMGDTDADVGALQRMLEADESVSKGDPVRSAMAAMFARDGQPQPPVQSDGSVPFS